MVPTRFLEILQGCVFHSGLGSVVLFDRIINQYVSLIGMDIGSTQSTPSGYSRLGMELGVGVGVGGYYY